MLLSDDGTGVARTRTGRFLRLESPPPGLLEALTIPTPGNEEAADYVGQLQKAMTSREEDDAHARWPISRRTVGIVGGRDMADSLVESLAEWGVTVLRYATVAELLAHGNHVSDLDGPGSRCDLVIGYAASPSERDGWEVLDTLPAVGTAWLRAYWEGEICFVDPICLTGDDPNSEQVRRRRLAASLVPRHLSDWQRAASASDTALLHTATLLLTSRLLTVVLAWARDSDQLEEYRRTLWKFVPALGVVSEHTVLGYQAPPPLDTMTHP